MNHVVRDGRHSNVTVAATCDQSENCRKHVMSHGALFTLAGSEGDGRTEILLTHQRVILTEQCSVHYLFLHDSHLLNIQLSYADTHVWTLCISYNEVSSHLEAMCLAVWCGMSGGPRIISFTHGSHTRKSPHTWKQCTYHGLFRQSLNWTETWTGEEWVTVLYVEPSQCNLYGNGTCTYILALYQSQPWSRSRSHISSVWRSHQCDVVCPTVRASYPLLHLVSNFSVTSLGITR